MIGKIAVLGGGSWGATLAAKLSQKDYDVRLWEYSQAVAEHLRTHRTLKTLPQLKLPDNVYVTSNMGEALDMRPVVISVTPSHTIRSTFETARTSGQLKKGALIINASKGLENDTNFRMSQVIRQICPDTTDLVALSGPSHAEEVAAHLPVLLVAASENHNASRRAAELLGSDLMRVYTSDDPIGVELGGALKNIYAVACGIVDGLGLGDNTKAALQARGLMEMTRLGSALGAKTVTFFGLTGLGDLIVTCNSKHSRNRHLGELLGRGKTLDEALGSMTMVAEGVNAVKAAHELAKKHSIEMPIVNEMMDVLFANKSPQGSIKDLMMRQRRAEMEGIVL